MRPNSPPQTTSVSSSRPRCLRSLSRAAIGRSTSLALLRQAVHDVVAGAGAVHVPAPVEELHVAHALLDQPAGEQAVVGERRLARARRRRASRTFFGSLADVHHLGHGDLHAVGQLVLADARQRLGVAELLRARSSFSLSQRVEAAAADVAAHALGVVDVQDRLADRAALHALVDATAGSRCSTGLLPPVGSVPPLISTTKPGRSWFSEPRP